MEKNEKLNHKQLQKDYENLQEKQKIIKKQVIVLTSSKYHVEEEREE